MRVLLVTPPLVTRAEVTEEMFAELGGLKLPQSRYAMAEAKRILDENPAKLQTRWDGDAAKAKAVHDAERRSRARKIRNA